MRSLLITNDYPPVPGGVSVVFYNLWRNIPPEKTMVLAPKLKGYKEFDEHGKVKVIRYPCFLPDSPLKKMYNCIVLFSFTLWLSLFSDVKRIHCGQLVVTGSIGLILFKVLRIPYILWCYGGETTPVYRKKKLLRFLVDRIIRNAGTYLVNSDFTAKELEAFGISKEKIHMYIPWIDSDRFKPTGKSKRLMVKYGLENKHVLLTVSRLAERKGHETVLRALPMVKKAIPEIMYLIVGTGPFEKHLRAVARELDLESNVVFTGYIDDVEIVEMYNLCDLYVMPNREIVDSTDSIEGFGVVFLEANACGKPVIGGKSGGTSDAVLDGVTGFLVNPDDIVGLAGIITALLRNERERTEMGERARKWVKENFSWKESSARVVPFI